MSRPLSSREKRLATIVGAIVFIFVNVWLIDWCRKTVTQSRAEIASKSKQLRFSKTLTADLGFWEKRDAWLREAQPKLTNSDTAGVQLLDQVKDLAKTHSIVLENPAIRVPERQPEYVSISVEVETKSAWKPLIDFLHELQSPAQFIAMESANVRIDPTDPTQIRGRFRIARWYASDGKGADVP